VAMSARCCAFRRCFNACPQIGGGYIITVFSCLRFGRTPKCVRGLVLAAVDRNGHTERCAVVLLNVESRPRHGACRVKENA
jgi:hypothetical protein